MQDAKEGLSILLTQEEIRDKVSELAKRIAEDYPAKKLHVVFCLKGAFIFCSDLVRALSHEGMDVTIDYVIAKSYCGKETTGKVEFYADIEIKGRDVLILEDLIDTGTTLKKLKAELEKKRPASLKVVCLMDKPSRRKSDVLVDYVGFEIPDRFVVGYGLDCDERFRNLPYIAALD